MNKIVILALLYFACINAAPQRMVLPRLPASVILSGKYQLIPEDKIVGGKEVVPNSLPFQISLQRKSSSGIFSQSCGGSILNENTILDAAHCVDGVADVSIFRVVAGEHDLFQVSSLEQNMDVNNILMHPDYNKKTSENDIALIYLAAPLDLSVPSAKPINMPPATWEFDPPAGIVATVSGWGTTSSGGSTSNVLLSVDIPIISDDACNAIYTDESEPKPKAIYESMLCAGGPNGNVDSCQGDSGGPFFIGTSTNAIQLGVVSWGRGCATGHYPGVYTQISYFLDWINENLH
ncbi:trypsin-1-like [Daphnia pulicaria]|uniref:trypsin-1-like n=1 Tax=Daphnia pulicaria TaxID=35523 RepID=UPI001EEB70E6|nr:trypsin-1-like [Daphnia pulicaria]